MNLRRYPVPRSSTFCKNAYVATHLEASYLQALAPSRDKSGEKVRPREFLASHESTRKRVLFRYQRF